MEVMEARLIRAAELNGEVDDDDTGESEAGGARQWPELKPTSGPHDLPRTCLPFPGGPF